MKKIILVFLALMIAGIIIPPSIYCGDFDFPSIDDEKPIVAPGKLIREDPERLTRPFYTCPKPDFEDQPTLDKENKLKKPEFAKKPSVVTVVFSMIRKGIPLP